ncbi:MAG TPA: Ig-like domain-containing protein [Longimicrobiales bacterium]|nr:Ig-like domain-containing protein [Longimicrobiales bacterium]
MTRRGIAGRLTALALGAVALSCARQGSPPGGPEDRVPPVVVSVEPDTFAVVDAGVDEIKVRFNERISEQAAGGRLAGAVEISPEVPDLEVTHDRRGLTIKVPGGLRPDLTYRVRITTGIRDMFGNPMVVPFEWMFSTGGEFTRNAVVGQVWDRATGELLQDVRVVLEPLERGPGPDSLLYASRSAQDGLFALRSVPPEGFRVLAFRDVNGNRQLGPSEPFGETEITTLGAADTVFLSIPLLVADTTAAVLAQYEIEDSVTVRLVFDDYLDPTVPVDGLQVTLGPVPPDSAGVQPPTPDGPLPNVSRILHEGAWETYRDSVRAAQDSLRALERQALADSLARADTLAADSLGADSAAVPAAPVRPAGPPAGLPGRPQAGPAPAVLPDGSPVPAQSIVLLLDGALPAEIPVRVEVRGATNLNGLGGGGGTVDVIWTPEPPDTLPLDSLPLDTLPPDTGGVVLDTMSSAGPGSADREPYLLPGLRSRS